MFGLLVLCVLLGLAYNSASPLGIHWRKAHGSSGKPGSASATVYANETMAVSLKRPAGPVADQPIYQNDTIAQSFTPPLVAAKPAADQPVRKPVLEMTWLEVKALMPAGKVVLVDARAPSYYQAGHIPGAISLPFTASPEEMAAFESKHPRHIPIVVYCGGEGCSLSHRMAETLMTQRGYAKVIVLSGGYAGWRLYERQAVASNKGQ